MFGEPKPLKEQDAEYRATIVGKDQTGIENALIEAKNGVFVLFTPTHGTPQMISATGEIPDGLIPKERLASYETSVKPRVATTHKMPEVGVNAVLIRCKQNRPHVDDPSLHVDDKHYKAFINQYPARFTEFVIDEALFNELNATDMPAAFYLYLPEGKDTTEFATVFAKQINSSVGNKLTDPGVQYNRPQDLVTVNNMLEKLGLKSAPALLAVKDMQTESKLVNNSKELEKFANNL